MKKLRLELDEIEVETFEVAEARKERGTVHGHHPTAWETCTCECSADTACDSNAAPCSGHPLSCGPTDCNDTGCDMFCPATYNPWENPAC